MSRNTPSIETALSAPIATHVRSAPTMAVTSDTELHGGQTILVLGKWKDVQRCLGI